MADNLTPIKVKGNGIAGTADANVLTIQGIAGMTKVLVTPDSVALPANQSVNVAQVNGTTTSVNNGTTDAGTQRVTLSSDSTGQVKLATGANTIGQLTANQSINLVQVNGATESATNPLFVELSNGTTAIGDSNPLPVYEVGSTGTVVDSGLLTSASLAAGANVIVAGADITTGKTGKLIEATASSSVPLKIEIQTYNGTTATTTRVFFTESMGSVIYIPKDDDEINQAGGTGKAFRIKWTNMDNTNAADVYGSLTWAEA